MYDLKKLKMVNWNGYPLQINHLKMKVEHGRLPILIGKMYQIKDIRYLIRDNI